MKRNRNKVLFAAMIVIFILSACRPLPPQIRTKTELQTISAGAIQVNDSNKVRLEEVKLAKIALAKDENTVIQAYMTIYDRSLPADSVTGLHPVAASGGMLILKTNKNVSEKQEAQRSVQTQEVQRTGTYLFIYFLKINYTNIFN